MAKYHIVIEDIDKGVEVSVETVVKPKPLDKDNALQVTTLLYRALVHQVEHIKRVVDGFQILNHLPEGEPNGTDIRKRTAKKPK